MLAVPGTNSSAGQITNCSPTFTKSVDKRITNNMRLLYLMVELAPDQFQKFKD